MPQGNSNECESVTFFAPADTFGGPKPVPSCLPAGVRVPDELREPTGDLNARPEDRIPNLITIINDAQLAKCAEGSYGESVVTKAGTLRETLSLTKFESITADVLNYIADNNLTEFIEDAATRRDLDAQEIARVTKMRLSSAYELVIAITAIQERLDATAYAAAVAQLSCYWLNTQQSAQCEYDDMARPDEHPDAVFSVTIPAGQIQSYISQADADAKAKNLAESSLNCFWISDAFTAKCEERPDRPEENMEPVPNDRVSVYGELPLRIGTVAIPPGLFVSYLDKNDANNQAQSYAYSQLVCFYVNDLQSVQCADPNARPYGEDPYTSVQEEVNIHTKTPGQFASIPKGFFTSEISTEEANQFAIEFANSLLECCFINQELHVECPAVPVVDENGTPVRDSEGNPIYIHASQTQSPIWSYTIKAGEFKSCESQKQVDDLAKAAIENILECYYCNQIVLPSCVPSWVLTAVTTGIVLDKPIHRTDGTVAMPAGTLYKLDLPLNVINPINPATGEPDAFFNPITGLPEDLSTWSIDATKGINSDAICYTSYQQAQQIANNAAIDRIDRATGQGEDCTYLNDPVIAACAAYDPYDPTNPSLEHWGYTPSGEKYKFYSRFTPAECIDPTISFPTIGDYIEIPGGTIAVSVLDTPGVRLEGDPYYDSNVDPDRNIALAKDYANKLAFNMAIAMLYCVYANPLTLGICEEPNSRDTNPDLCYEQYYSTVTGQYEYTLDSNGDLIKLSQWIIGKYKTPVGLMSTSNTRGNPIRVEKGTFVSMISLEDVYDKTRTFIDSLILCLYCNQVATASCYDTSMQQNQATVPECTITASSLAEANRIAQALAQSMLVCIDLSTTTGPAGPAGPPGPAGPAGPAGPSGSSAPCDAGCNGVYS